jgi:regulatory protein
VRRRSTRYGARRVAHELEQLGVSSAERAAAVAVLQASEADRAWEAWSRRFGEPPASLQERARQQRFLMGRGFEAGAVAAVFRRLRDHPASR